MDKLSINMFSQHWRQSLKKPNQKQQMDKQSHMRKGNCIFKAGRNLFGNMTIAVQSSGLDSRELLVCNIPDARNAQKVTEASIYKTVEQVHWNSPMLSLSPCYLEWLWFREGIVLKTHGEDIRHLFSTMQRYRKPRNLGYAWYLLEKEMQDVTSSLLQECRSRLQNPTVERSLIK